jgi:hypothetical protein
VLGHLAGPTCQRLLHQALQEPSTTVRGKGCNASRCSK